jgi:hypothetical protein
MRPGNASVHLDIYSAFMQCAEPRNLSDPLERGWKKGLSGEARVDGENDYPVNVWQKINQAGERGWQTERQPRAHAERSDLLQETKWPSAGFDMHGDTRWLQLR